VNQKLGRAFNASGAAPIIVFLLFTGNQKTQVVSKLNIFTHGEEHGSGLYGIGIMKSGIDRSNTHQFWPVSGWKSESVLPVLILFSLLRSLLQAGDFKSSGSKNDICHLRSSPMFEDSTMIEERTEAHVSPLPKMARSCLNTLDVKC
jgi:hypothetical protein